MSRLRTLVPTAVDKAATPRPTTPSAPKPGAPRIKTFLATQVRDAMNAARRELGEDAILIQTKPVIAANGAAKYEVTFGVVEGRSTEKQHDNLDLKSEATAAKPEAASASVATAVAEPPSKAPAPAPVSAPAPAPSPAPASAKELADLRMDIAALQSMVARYLLRPDAASGPAFPAAELRDLLINQGVHAELAGEWISALLDTHPLNETLTPQALEGHLRSRIQFDASLGHSDLGRKAVVLVGPAGSGKTTALIKLALEYGVKRGRKVEILSFHPSRMELDRALEGTATMLDIPWRAFTSPAKLSQAIDAAQSSDALVLVDTCGAALDTPGMEDLSRTLAGHPHAETHLVLSAAWNASSIRRAVERFEVFQPARLLFTTLDYTTAVGPILQEAWRTGKPLSFFNRGPLGGSTLEAADLQWLLRTMEDAPFRG